MPLPNNPACGPKSKNVKLHESGSHPVTRSGTAPLQKIAKPIRVGTGQSWANLMKSDVQEYASSHAHGTRSDAGPGLFGKLIGGIRGLFSKPAKNP